MVARWLTLEHLVYQTISLYLSSKLGALMIVLLGITWHHPIYEDEEILRVKPPPHGTSDERRHLPSIQGFHAHSHSPGFQWKEDYSLSVGFFSKDILSVLIVLKGISNSNNSSSFTISKNSIAPR